MTQVPPRRRPWSSSPWASVGVGLAVGVLLAFVGAYVWEVVLSGPAEPVAEMARATDSIDLFRLPSGTAREMFLLPAGPDGIGEPALASRLFPGEGTSRELASLVLANVSASESWQVDLSRDPLTCLTEEGGAWEDFADLSGPIQAGDLSSADRVRLRSLGGGRSRIVVEPRSVRRILLALPQGRVLKDLTRVKWGTTPLLKDRLGLDRVRRFRENPDAATTGR